MVKSDQTRAEVQRALREQAREANLGRAKAEAARAVVVAEEVDAQAIQRASQAVKTALSRRAGEWLAASELRRAVASRVRDRFEDALASLELAGDIEVEATAYRGRAGTRMRLRG
jgi:hypothetical protein